MKLSSQSQSNIEEAIKKALTSFNATSDQQVITDIHLQPQTEDGGRLIVWDDDDNKRATAMVPEWDGYDDDDLYEEVELPLRNVLKRMKEKELLDNVVLMKPYSFTLVDEDKETVAELFLVDDDTLMLNDDELLKGLDEELDSFLKELLEK